MGLFRRHHPIYLFGGVAVPVITGFSPAAGAVGDQITITGANFGVAQGLGSILFTNIAASITNTSTVVSWSDTVIVAKVPDGVTFPMAGSYISVVTNTSQQANSAATFLWTGGAAHFTAASSQVMTIADNADLSLGGTQNFTVAGWHKMDDKAGHRAFFAKCTNLGGPSSCEYACWYRSDSDRYEFRASTGAVIAALVANVFGSPTAGVWNFVACRYNGTVLNISINNGASNTTALLSIQDSTAAFALGNAPGLSTFHNGSIDGVGFWRRSLSNAEITTLYNAGAGLNYASALALGGGLLASAVAWWDLDDAAGSGATWIDRIGTNSLTAGAGAAAPTSVRGVR